jgi:hypothetical protein
VKDETENFVTKQPRVSLLHIIDTSRLLEVLCEDNRAIVRAASAASKAADFILAFGADATTSAAAPVEPEELCGISAVLSARRYASVTNGE